MSDGTISDAGAALFARFAYPPNALGLCGPDDTTVLLEHASDLAMLRRLAVEFEGAWPYLELIAGGAGITDPLDARVVDTYWVGGPLLDTVPVSRLGRSLDERFRRLVGPDWRRLVEVVEAGAVPHHNFHVFAVYPWVGLIRRGVVDEPLRVLDRCRIRWGRVDAVTGDEAEVRSRGLAWTGDRLALGSARTERVRWRREGRAFIPPPRRGDRVAMHWDWVCDVLSASRLSALRNQTLRQLRLVNDQVAHPGPAAVLA